MSAEKKLELVEEQNKKQYQEISSLFSAKRELFEANQILNEKSQKKLEEMASAHQLAIKKMEDKLEQAQTLSRNLQSQLLQKEAQIEELKKVEEKLEESKKKVHALQHNLSSREKQLEKSEQSASLLTKQKAEMEQKFTSYKSKASAAISDLSSKNKELQKIVSEMELNQINQENVGELREKHSQLKGEYGKIVARLNESAEKYEQEKTLNDRLKNSISQLESELLELKANNELQQERAYVPVSEKEDKVDRKKEKEISEMMERNKSLESETQQLSEQVGKQKGMLERMEEGMIKLKEKLKKSESLSKENEELKAKLRDLNKILDETHRNLDAIAKDNESHIRAAENLQKEKVTNAPSYSLQMKHTIYIFSI